MIQYSDSFFRRADDHLVCQDHALHGEVKNMKYAILADGCSSAPNSELGAKILTSTLKQYLWDGCDVPLSYGMAIGHANAIRVSLDVSDQVLFATLLMVCGKGENFLSAIQGDGFLVGHRKNGIYDIIQQEFKPNPAPYYPAYWIDDTTSNAYEKSFSNYKMIRNHWQFDCLTQELELKNSGEFVLMEFKKPFIDEWSGDEYDMVMVLSDGLSGLYRSETKSIISLQEVLKELLVFKGFSGAFIQRRMQFFFKRIQELGWRTSDDFSCAAVSHG